jgi:aldehyde:ferredoxin oxidoreductase
MIAAGHAFPEIDVDLLDHKTNLGVAPQVIRHQDWRTFVDSSGSCLFVNTPFDDLVDMVSSATGREETVASLSRAGERIFTLKRLINLKLGLTRSDEVLPKLLQRPLSDGGSEGFVPDSDVLLRDYYLERDWDLASGRPSKRKLAELGLDQFA